MKKKNEIFLGDIIRYKASYGNRGECYGMVKDFNFFNFINHRQETFSVLWFDDSDGPNMAIQDIKPPYLHLVDRGIKWFKES